MLSSNSKTDSSQKLKTEPGFDFTLKQIQNLDIECNNSTTKNWKISSQPKDKKSNLRELCFFC